MGVISPIATDSNGTPIQTGSMQSLGKDDFLQLLITKMQNQDPLNPMTDEDFVAQLAQFSSLEQMNNIADGIGVSNEWDYLQMQSLNNVMASGLIGKDVMAVYDDVYVDANSTPQIAYTLEEYAAKLTFTIRNAEGTIMTTLTQEDRGIGQHSITWDGKDASGNTVPEGSYSIEVSAEGTSGNEFTPELSFVGKVEAVVYRNGSAYLTVDGTEIPLGDVTSIAEAGTYTGKLDDGDDS